MKMKQNNLTWKPAPISSYTTFRERLGLIGILIPLDEAKYLRIRDDITSNNVEIPLFKNDNVFTDVTISKRQIIMLATQESLFNDDLDIDVELSTFMPEPIHGEWLYAKYDRLYNTIGCINNIPTITQSFNRKDIFEQQLGMVGNPNHFMVIAISKININKLTYEGLKRIKQQQDKTK